MPSKKLTAKQEMFVKEYLIDLNATQAAIRAGYSKKTAKDIACENLAKPYIQEAIAEAMQKRMERTEVDADWLLRRFVDEAEADVADLYDEDGALKPVHDWPLVWRQGLVSGIDIDEQMLDGQPIGRVAKVKLSDRIRRLELIGKHTNIQAFLEKSETKLDLDGGVVLWGNKDTK